MLAQGFITGSRGHLSSVRAYENTHNSVSSLALIAMVVGEERLRSAQCADASP